jgi:hypothetical protein
MIGISFSDEVVFLWIREFWQSVQMRVKTQHRAHIVKNAMKGEYLAWLMSLDRASSVRGDAPMTGSTARSN